MFGLAGPFLPPLVVGGWVGGTTTTGLWHRKVSSHPPHPLSRTTSEINQDISTRGENMYTLDLCVSSDRLTSLTSQESAQHEILKQKFLKPVC